MSSLYNILFAAGFFGTLAFAAGFGRRAERLGAALYLGVALLTWGLEWGVGINPALKLVTDLTLAFALAFLLIRYKKLWIGVACVATTLFCAFSATRLVGFPLSPFGYILALNLSSLIALVALAAGTWVERWGPADPYAEFEDALGATQAAQTT